MPTYESNKRSTAKRRAEAIDRVEFTLPKGGKEQIKAHAAAHQPEVGEPFQSGYSPRGSVNAFIQRAIREAMERDAAAAELAESHAKVFAEAGREGLLQKRKRGRPKGKSGA